MALSVPECMFMTLKFILFTNALREGNKMLCLFCFVSGKGAGERVKHLDDIRIVQGTDNSIAKMRCDGWSECWAESESPGTVKYCSNMHQVCDSVVQFAEGK